MTTPINGPGDVKVGDLVRVDIGNDFRSNHVVATVERVNPATLSVILPGGARLRRPYTTKKTSRVFRQTARYTVTTFARLDAWDRWYEAKPSAHTGSPTFGADMAVASVVAMAAEVRDRPNDVCAQVHRLSAWLKAEPSRDAP